MNEVNVGFGSPKDVASSEVDRMRGNFVVTTLFHLRFHNYPVWLQQ